MSKFKQIDVDRYINGVLFPLLFVWLFLSISSCQEAKVEENNSLITIPTAFDVLQKFADPPVEYSLSFYWGWDGNVTEEVMSRDLDTFKEK